MGTLPTYPPVDMTVTADPNNPEVAPNPVTDNSLIPPQPPPDYSFTNAANNDPEVQAAAVHHSRIASSIQGAVHALLGGGRQLNIVRNPDNSVSVVEAPTTPGQRWGNVAAAALAGATQGFANSFGTGAPVNAFAGGVQAGQQLVQGRQDRTLDMADRLNKQDRDAQMFKANMALLNQRIVAGAWNQHRAEITAAEGEDDRQAAIDKAMREANARVIHFDSGGDADQLMERIAQAYNTDPELAQAHHDGRSPVFTTYDSQGKPIGADAYVIPVDKMKQLYTKPYQRTRLQFNPDDPTKPLQRVNLGEELEPNSISVENHMAMMQADQDADLKTQDAWAKNKTNEELKSAQAELAQARKEWGPQGGMVALTPTDLNSWVKQLTNIHSGVTIANVPPKQRAAVLGAVNDQGLTLAKPLTADELKRSDLANNTIANIQEAQRILEAHPDMFGPAGWGKTKFQQALEGGNPDAIKFQTAITLANLPAIGIHGVRGSWAAKDLAKYDSNLYLNAASMRGVLGEIMRSANEFAPAGGRVLPTPPGATTPPVTTTPEGARIVPTTPQTTGLAATPGGSKGRVSVGAAMQMPMNKGKTQDEVIKDLTDRGYTPIP